ncbi:unnamed protein product [Heterosigma akashiwo]
MTQPINLIFRFLQNVTSRAQAHLLPSLLHSAPLTYPLNRILQPRRTRIQIWLYEQTAMRIEESLFTHVKNMPFVATCHLGLNVHTLQTESHIYLNPFPLALLLVAQKLL